MSKKSAIAFAIEVQLALDEKPPIGLRGTLMGAPVAAVDEVPDAAAGVDAAADLRARLSATRDGFMALRAGGGGAGYPANQVRNFLARVSFLLRADDPPLQFNWWKVDADQAGTTVFYALIDQIAAETTPIDQKGEGQK